MLKNLGAASLNSLLMFFNYIWTAHEFPSAWREATVVPVLKQEKDGTDPLHYRPIALTSCVCKLMERIVNDRLVWFLESNGFFNRAQCGFRRNRCTTDHLISLDTAIRQSFTSKQHTFAIFFDIEKAYDTAWRHAILRKLRNAGIRGHMGHFLANFVRERSFRVKVGSSLSEGFVQESGVPQGSVLSVTLFGVLINDICDSLPPTIHRSLFVDDFAVWVSTSTSVSAQRQLQLCIDGLTRWSLLNGFRFSVGKTVCLHFCRRTRYCPDIVLRLYGQRIPVRNEAKFLGLTFDRRLSYSPHIAQLRDRCASRSNILKVVSRMSYGADRTTLLRLYNALIMPVLDYGAIIYDGALSCAKVSLDSLHHACVRVATGAFRTSRRASLLVDAGVMPLDLRRKRLALRYACKIKQDHDNPAYDWIFDRSLIDRLAATRLSSSRALCSRVHSWVADTDIDLDSLATRRTSRVEPWRMAMFSCDLELLQYSKSSILPEEFRHHALESLARYAEYRSFFTDGSKGNEGVGCAFVSSRTTRRFRLPDTASVFTSELYAIYQVLKHIRRRSYNRCLIVTDSASSVMALRSQLISSSLILRTLELLTELSSAGVEVKLLWVPSHVGVQGNERADEAAKVASRSSNIRRLKVEADDMKPSINRLLLDEWQSRWQNEPDCALKRLRPRVEPWESSSRRRRIEEVALTRLRIGHCHATHSYLLTGSEPPVCVHCDARLTVRHVLSPGDSCEQLRATRLNFFPDASLDDILGSFPTVAIPQVLAYLRHIRFDVVYNAGLAQAARPAPTRQSV
jgi:ribonuclease HI